MPPAVLDRARTSLRLRGLDHDAHVPGRGQGEPAAPCGDQSERLLVEQEERGEHPLGDPVAGQDVVVAELAR